MTFFNLKLRKWLQYDSAPQTMIDQLLMDLDSRQQPMRLKLFRGFWQFQILLQKSYLHIAVDEVVTSINITEGFTFQNYHYGSKADVLAATHSLVILDIPCFMRSLGLYLRLRKTRRSSLVTGYPLRFENVLRTVNEVWEMVCFEAGSRNNCSSAQMRNLDRVSWSQEPKCHGVSCSNSGEKKSGIVSGS